MSTDDIKILLEAFYEGNTTSEQEKLLQAYFEGDDIAPELLPERDAFLAICNLPQMSVPDALEADLNSLLDELDATQAHEEEVVPMQTIAKKKKLVWQYVGIAASIVLLIVGGLYITVGKGVEGQPQPIAQKNVLIADSTTNEISPEDKQKIKLAENAMVLLSEKLNKGMGQLTIVSTNVDKSNKTLDKVLKRNRI